MRIFVVEKGGLQKDSGTTSGWTVRLKIIEKKLSKCLVVSFFFTTFALSKTNRIMVAQLLKYNGKWSVYLNDARTYQFIGKGKKFCQNKVNGLNKCN